MKKADIQGGLGVFTLSPFFYSAEPRGKTTALQKKRH